MIQYISPIQERILLTLARHRFLTVSQLFDCGVGKPNRIRDALALLRERKLTDKQRFGNIQGVAYKGTVQDIHFLSNKGANVLEEHGLLTAEEIKYPKSKNTFFRQDYFHRVATINSEISFERWLLENNASKLFCCNYSDKTGSQRNSTQTGTLKSVTRLTFESGSYIEPDIIFGYQRNEKNYLFCLEIYNGKDTKRVIEQLVKLAEATKESLVAQAFGYQNANRVLCSFEYESNMKAVLERITREPTFQKAGIEKFFFFNLHDKVKENFGKDWISIEGEFQNFTSF